MNTQTTRPLSFVRATLLLLTGAAASLALSGCGLGTAATPASSEATIVSNFGGKLQGGPNPIIGATVKIYSTGTVSGGVVTAQNYGTGTLLQEANTAPGRSAGQDTDSFGNFRFAGGFACPAGQFAYVASSGGNTGAAGADGSGATASVTVDTTNGSPTLGKVTSVTPVAQGSLYGSAVVTITGDGTGATATATVSNGMVTGYTVTNGGSGYTTATATVTPGPNAVNAAAVLVAVLGRCEDLYTGTVYTAGKTIFVNELTTIAAAYALGNFASTSGTGAATVVGIGADANNNATTGSATQAAGLLHAFQNAANLVNVFTNTGIGSPNGAYAVSPANTAAIVPQALINALGNSLVACVNSDGTANAPACATIFGATTLAGSTAPTNTFQAMINLARNPLLTGAGTNPSTAVAYVPADIFNAAAPTASVYTPTLTSSPADWTISIHYPAGIGLVAGTSQGLQYPPSGTLDINDNLYVGNQDAFTAPTKSNVLGFGSNGAFLGTSADTTVSTSGQGVSADALGNVYQMGSATTSTAVALIRYTPSGGAPGAGTPFSYAAATNQGAPISSAVDKLNNVWYSTNSTAAANKSVWKFTPGVNNPAFQFQATTGLATNGIAVDPGQNIWATSYNGSTSTGTAVISVLQNMGTVAAPTYAPVSGAPATANLTVTLTPSNSGVGLYGIAFAPATATANTPNYIGYAATNLSLTASPGRQGFTPLIPSVTTPSVTVASVAQGTPVVGTTGAPISNPRYIASDASGALWAADSGGNRIRFFSPNLNAALQNTYLRPCLVVVAGNNITCSNALIGPRYVLPDSTGTLWVVNIGSATNTGSVDQIIGASTPTYPLLSLGLSTTKP